MSKSRELKKRCGIDNCPSTRFHLDDGLLFCGEGHQQEQGPETQADVDFEFSTQRVSKSRAKREETQGKTSNVFRGPEAFALFLKSYQHILQKQCYVLVHTFGLPPRFEEVVRNQLWAPRLRLLTDRLETSDDATVFSSQATTDTEGHAKGGYRGRRRERKSRSKVIPSLLDSLGMCYLGMIVLRLPISLGDLHRWAYREDIPYIRAVRHLPRWVKDRLPATYLMALDTKSILGVDDLRITVHELSLFYDQQFNITFPVLNHPLVLFKHVRNLAFPLDVFPAVRRIAKLLDIDFAFPKTRPRQRMSSMPELTLVALLVIAVKLYYPFDSIERHPRSVTDPGLLTLDWDQWCKAQKEYDSRETADGNLGRGNEIKVEEKDVFDLSSEQMDEYLDWFENTWVDEERARNHPRGYPEQLLDMFPTGRQQAGPTRSTTQEENQANDDALERKLRTVQGQLKVRKVISDRDARTSRLPVDRIGSYYKRYRKIEDLSLTARTFHETAARLVAVSLSSLLVAVTQVEQKLIRLRKRDIEAGDVDGDISDRASDVSGLPMDVDGTSSESDTDMKDTKVMESVEESDTSDSLYSSDESS